MERVDCIIVGGGLAGLSAAYGLAVEGLEVMVLERGDYSGAKNVTGGRLYASFIRDIYPELWESAPFERPIAREFLTFMGDGAHTTVELASDRFATAPYQSYTVLRARFDQWFADQVMEKGGMVIPKMRADELLVEDGKVIGIRAGDDEIGADVTIIAEGVLGMLSTAAGLREEPAPRDHALGFKEIIELPAGTIEDRWHLNEGEGAAQLFVG
jgi:electron transfer flavoprotein-quinone oxidoreductase